MYDVVPPSNGGSVGTGRKNTRPVRRMVSGKARRMPQSAPPAKAPVVQFEWKLPARLRRPVKYELARQRQKQRQKEAIIRFERRPLYTELPGKYPAQVKRPAPKAPGNRQGGAEQHTGDVWREKKPGASITMPPYAGGFMRTSGGQPARKAAPSRPARGAGRAVPVSQQVQVPITGERDVPYEWKEKGKRTGETKEGRAVQPPASGWRSRFALPLHFSIFPKSVGPARAGQDVAPAEVIKEEWRKKKLQGS